MYMDCPLVSGECDVNAYWTPLQRFLARNSIVPLQVTNELRSERVSVALHTLTCIILFACTIAAMPSKKVINFGAGPGKLPEEVMAEIQKELVNYNNTYISVMEMSHRSKDFSDIVETAQNTLREILAVPPNYKILFMQGGGTGMFAAVALNLMSSSGTADYIVSGSWSAKAAKEAEKYGKVNVVHVKPDKHIRFPDPKTYNLNPEASYLYYCDNETVHGVEAPFIPVPPEGVPLVVDMSSNILSRRFDVSKFGVIFAGAQKNIGPAGVTLVIVREDLLGRPLPYCPIVLDFTIMAKDNSLHNTPPTFGIYAVGRVFDWIRRSGGIEEMEDRAKTKSQTIYDVIAKSNGFYTCPVHPEHRSRMNVPFRINGGDEKLEQEFVTGAQKLGMIQLKGHRSVGGIRASLYNAVTVEEAKALARYMEDFYQDHKKI